MSCITEILKLKDAQEVLVPDDQWIAVEGGGTYRNYEYIIVLNVNGHRCGYIALPPEHKYSKTPMEERDFLGSGRKRPHWDYDGLDIDCHGGLTFMAPNHSLKDLIDVDCNEMWIGFDCGHSDDMCDIEAYRKYYGEENTKEKESFFNAMNHGYDGQSIKDFTYVEMECHSIIDQLIQTE